MTCPACGFQSLPSQKFCRSCGANLRITTRPLTQTAGVSDLETTSAVGPQREAQPGRNVLLWGFVTMLLGAAIGVVGKKLLHQDIVTVVGIIISLVGMFLTVYPYLSPPRPTKHRPDPPLRPGEVNPPTPAKSLPPASFGYMPSITERTTDLLENSGATRPQPDESMSWKPNSDSGDPG